MKRRNGRLNYQHYEQMNENTDNVIITRDEPNFHGSATRILIEDETERMYFFGGFFEYDRVGFCYDSFKKETALALADWIYKHYKEEKK